MKKLRRLALATALLGGGIGFFAVANARAAANQIPIFVAPSPDQFTHFTGVVGTPIEFDVQGEDADGIPPSFTYDKHTASTQVTHTPVALPAPTNVYDAKEHVVITAPAAGDYGVTITVTDGIDAFNTRILFFHFDAPVNNAPVIDVAPSDSGATPAYTRYFGQPISTVIQGHDSDGVASFSIVPPVAGASITPHTPAAAVGPTFNFDPTAAGAGVKTINLVLTDDDGATDTQTFTINVLGKQPTALYAHDALVAIPGRRGPLPLTVSATLLGLGDSPLPGQQIVFSLRGNYLCTGVTNADGYASCQAVISAVLATLNLDYDATYFGDAIHQGATSDGDIIGLLGLPLP